MENQEKIFYYHSEFKENHKKSRYTVSGRFSDDGNTLSLAYARKGRNDNFSKHYGRDLSTSRLFDKVEGYYNVVNIDGDTSTKRFIEEAKRFVKY
jgi:hypothetical protein